MPDSPNWLDEVVELDDQIADLREEVDRLRTRLAKYEQPDDGKPLTEETFLSMVSMEQGFGDCIFGVVGSHRVWFHRPCSVRGPAVSFESGDVFRNPTLGWFRRLVSVLKQE